MEKIIRMQKLQKMEKIWNKNIGSYVPRMIAGIKEVLHEHKTQNKTRLKIIILFISWPSNIRQMQKLNINKSSSLPGVIY